MGIIIESLAPTLLIFSFAAFAFFISLPRLKLWIKGQYDERLKNKAPLDWTEYFFYTFFIGFAKFSDPTAGIYLGAVVLLLLHPLYNPFVFVAYIVVLIVTIISVTRFVIQGFSALKISLGKAKVFL